MVVSPFLLFPRINAINFILSMCSHYKTILVFFYCRNKHNSQKQHEKKGFIADHHEENLWAELILKHQSPSLWCTSSNKATSTNPPHLFKQCQSLVTKHSNVCAYRVCAYSNYSILGLRFSMVSTLAFQLWYRNDSFPALFYFLLLPQFRLLFQSKFASLTPVNCPWVIFFLF